MSTLHRGLTRVFALLLDPLAAFPPLVGVTLISAVSGVLVLLGFRVASKPNAIRVARQRAQAHLLAVRLYRDDLTVVLRSQRALLGALLVYLGNMMVPFVVMLVPFALIFAQLDARYGSRALHPGERAIVTAIFAPQTSDRWRLTSDTGVVVDSLPVHIPARDEIDWRIRALAPGEHEVVLANDQQRVRKEVRVAIEPQGAAPRRSVADIAALFVAPTETPIEADVGVRSIRVLYPPLPLAVLGWHVHWMVIFLIVSTAVALLLRKRVGVEF